MAHEYVFRGEHKPFAPDPKDERAREAAKREAEQLVNQPSVRNETLPHDADIEERVGEYQVGGLDAFGTNSETQAPDDRTGGGTDHHP
jgi:hypothetical protein